MRALKSPWRYAPCDANPAPARRNRANAVRFTTRTEHGIDRSDSKNSKPKTCSLVEGDVHPLAVAVEREVGVAEQLRVALPEGEGRLAVAHGGR